MQTLANGVHPHKQELTGNLPLPKANQRRFTVADYLKQAPTFQQPVFFHSPIGPLRVIGCIAKPRCYPFLRCVTQRGALVEFAVLYSTHLDTDLCPDCLGSGEVPSTDVTGMVATCPCQCDEAGAHVQQYP